MTRNIRLIAVLISCAAAAAAGLYGIWCMKHGLLDAHRRGDGRLIIFSCMAPFAAVLIAIVAIFYRNQDGA
jgi:hypothetical protein